MPRVAALCAVRRSEMAITEAPSISQVFVIASRFAQDALPWAWRDPWPVSANPGDPLRLESSAHSAPLRSDEVNSTETLLQSHISSDRTTLRAG